MSHASVLPEELTKFFGSPFVETLQLTWSVRHSLDKGSLPCNTTCIESAQMQENAQGSQSSTQNEITN